MLTPLIKKLFIVTLIFNATLSLIGAAIERSIGAFIYLFIMGVFIFSVFPIFSVLIDFFTRKALRKPLISYFFTNILIGVCLIVISSLIVGQEHFVKIFFSGIYSLVLVEVYNKAIKKQPGANTV